MSRKFASPATAATIHPRSLKLMRHLQSLVELKRPEGAAVAIIFANDIRTGISSALRLAQLNELHVIIGLAWLIIYNIFALLLASGAFVKVRISPAYAGLGEVVSGLPVVPLRSMST
jgi:hypothetical protein